MKTRLLIISIIAIAVSIPTFWNDQAYALCTAEVNYDSALKNSELVFTGTVTRLDNYDGPQKVTFFIHDVIKGEIDTPKYILENSGLMFLENDTITSSSVSVDYKIGKTYKVYVENDQTNRCTTKITTPPADYMWAPGPEDGNYYSENPVWVDPCDEGYGLSDGVCITLEEMNKDLPTCSANPRHDFGKCKKNMEEPPNTFEQVKASCNNGGEDIFLEWWDDDVYYNNVKCDVLDRDKPGPRIQKQPPLKQFKAGSSFDEIQCKQNLVLIQKYDDSPACVTESTKLKLIERGWIKMDDSQIRIPVSVPVPTDPLDITINGSHTPPIIPIKAGEIKEIDILLEPKVPIVSSTVNIKSYFGSAGECIDINIDSYCPGRGIDMVLSDTSITSQKEITLTISIPGNMTSGTYAYLIETKTLFESSDYNELRTIGKSIRFDLKVE